MFEDQLASVIRGIRSNVLLDVSVLVIVDPHHLVPGDVGEVGDEAGLAHTGVALHEDRMLAHGHDPREVTQVLLHSLCQDVVALGSGLTLASADPEPGNIDTVLVCLQDWLFKKLVRVFHTSHMFDDQVPHNWIT